MSTNDRRYNRLWARDRRAGTRRCVPAAPIVDHIQALTAQGIPREAIAQAAGIAHRTINHLLTGQRTVQRPTAQLILAVTPEAARARTSPSKLVPATGTVRRLQALRAIGWSRETLIQRTGLGHDTIRRALDKTTTHVTHATYDAVRATYDRLSMTPGPSARARMAANERGWAPPLAWDDNIDDPDAVPDLGQDAERSDDDIDHAAVQRRMAGDRSVRLTPAEAREVILGLRALGHTYDQIRELTALKPDRYVRPSRRAQAERAAA